MIFVARCTEGIFEKLAHYIPLYIANDKKFSAQVGSLYFQKYILENTRLQAINFVQKISPD
jgi:hypothetical protein